MTADPSKPISALISDLNKLFDRLTYYQEPVSDQQKASALKLALPSKFGVLKTVLDSQKTLSFKEVCEQLVSHDTTKKTMTYRPFTSSATPSQSHHVARAPGRNCFNCGERHVIKYCRVPCTKEGHPLRKRLPTPDPRIKAPTENKKRKHDSKSNQPGPRHDKGEGRQGKRQVQL